MATEGRWGEPTSTVDWCEANYRHTELVAELWNTTSSLAMVLVALVGLWLHHRVLPARFLFAFALLALVGVGSVAFHGALKFELQMLDELPMVYLVVWMVYVLVECGPTRRIGAWFPIALATYAVGVTALVTTSRGETQFAIFHVSFGALELFSLACVYLLDRRTSALAPRRLFRLGISAYLIAIAIWFVDLRFCPFVSEALPAVGLFNPQLHAGWHLLVSYGFYALLLVIALDQARARGVPLRLVWFAGVFPRLRGA